MTAKQLIDILKDYPDHLVTVHVDAGEESNRVCIGDLRIARPKDNFKSRPFLWICNESNTIDNANINRERHYKIIEVNEK